MPNMNSIDEVYAKLCSLVELRASYAKLEESGGDHPNTAKIWAEITNLLAVSDSVAIALLERCSKNQIYLLSEVFDDISAVLRSRVFTNYLDTLQSKFSKLDLSVDIEFAKLSLEGGSKTKNDLPCITRRST